MAEHKPIFYDEDRSRWRRTRRVAEIAGAVFALLLIVFLLNVIRKPDLPELLLPDTTPALRAIRSKRVHAKLVRIGRRRRVAALGTVPQNYDPLRAAFYVSWEPYSLASLQQHYKDIDLLIPEVLHSISTDGRLEVRAQDNSLHTVQLDGTLDVDPDLKLTQWLRAIKEKDGVEMPVMPLLNNSDGIVWKTTEMTALLARRDARLRLAKSVVSYVLSQKDQGAVLDFEDVPEKSQPDFRRFIEELASALHARDLKLMVALPAADWSYDYRFIGSKADAVILMNYDQHWTTSPPGPVAGQSWFLTNLRKILELVPRDKLVMGIANYGYDWPSRTRKDRHPVATAVSFQLGASKALESQSDIDFDSASLNPHYSYEDDNNVVHNVWMLDALTAYNELRASERAGVSGTAIWRLGSEDPSVWNIWDTTHPTDDVRAKLEELTPGYDLILEGDGDIWRILSTPQSGKRSFDYDPGTDTFTDENFESYPLTWRIDQMGAAPHEIALTFDDGPDPKWTPKVLEILEKKGVPATFFTIGVEADASPQILRREYADGDEIGNHTYTHPAFDDLSKPQLQLELNFTERLLEGTLGVKTLLFRPPYGIDHQPETASEISLLPVPQSMGYVIVGSRVDPHDWGEVNGGAPPPASVIVQRVLDQAVHGPGNIVLMHDGGGDRAQTVAALPQVIDGLRGAGFHLVLVSDLLQQTRAQVMPPLSHQEWLITRVDALIFDLFNWARLCITFIYITGILLVSGRALFIGLLAIAEKLRPAIREQPGYRTTVTVTVPAYNEEAAIVSTVRSVLASRHPVSEVIVVDDGSADRTAERVREAFGRDPRVRLISQPNGGKPSALNHALAVASGEIVVSIDADTSVAPDAVGLLVRHFADPRVAAAAGNVKVLNRNRWLTRWQALEYITSQNLEKRAFDLLNCIPVVPGAIGAWRASVVRDSGGFSGDTVAEDTDLTMTIRRQGWKILYDELALGYTEVPETIDALVRQRFRWTFGTLQAVWKHRDTFARKEYGTLGWVTLPNLFLFQILLPLVSPVIDLLFILSILFWALAQFHITRLPGPWTGQDVERSLIFFAAFMLIDLLTCVVAFVLEKHEDWTLLLPLLIQRFYYRQMMYVVIFRAVKEAVHGRGVGWRGVEPQVPAPLAHA